MYQVLGSISSDASGFKVENNVVYINPVFLYYYRGYDLIFRVWDNSNDYTDFEYLYEFIPMSAIIENGQIVSSGDTTFNGQDLAQYLPQAIVGVAPSGDNSGSGILGGLWTILNNWYNNLFGLSSSDISNMYDQASVYLSSGDTPENFYTTIVNTVTATSGDFVLSWNDVILSFNIKDTNYSGLLINGSSLNFSKFIRDNAVFYTIWGYFQVILNFSTFYLLFISWYRVILDILGVSEDLIQDDSEDIQVVKSTIVSHTTSIDTTTGEVKPSKYYRKTTSTRTNVKE